jgi:hypothetical protein
MGRSPLGKEEEAGQVRGAHTKTKDAGAIGSPSRQLPCGAMPARRFRLVRLGLWLGALGAAAWFVQRYQRSRQELATVAETGWSAVAEPNDAPIVAPAPGDTETSGAPVAPVTKAAPVAPVTKAAPATMAAPPEEAPAAGPGRIPAGWVAPDPGGICPESHPIKAKLSSKLFHLPGMVAYARTNPDRCYRDEAAAESDGLRKAKR